MDAERRAHFDGPFGRGLRWNELCSQAGHVADSHELRTKLKALFTSLLHTFVSMLDGALFSTVPAAWERVASCAWESV